MIRVVSFDVDDTLYDFNTVSRRALEFVARRLREEVGEPGALLDVDGVVAHLEATAESMDHPYARLDEFRRCAFTRLLARYGVRRPDLAEELGRVYLRHRFEGITPYPEARGVLLELRGSYTLCGISNGEQDLRMLGLDGLLSFVIVASDAGFQKPDARIFRAAMDRAGCRPHELAHVGDSLLSDVAGAKAAGAWAIWFNPSRCALSGEEAPDKEIHSLAELPDALDALNVKSAQGE